MLDLKITGGTLIDGSGKPGTPSDIGVTGERISETGDLSRTNASKTLDAKGCIVCPGFIDVHSHSDTYLLIEPLAQSKIFQGITTEITGNCGASAAPIKTLDDLPSDWARKKYPGKWSSMREFLSLLRDVGPALNVATLVGHGKIRGRVMGYGNKRPSRAEMSDMIRLLEQSMEDGAIGMSSGLIYPPGMFSDIDEMTELAGRIALRNGIYTSHMRSEGTGLLEALDEIIEVASNSGVRTQISHLKTAGRKNWGFITQALSKIRNALSAGINIAADRYPYTASNTDLDTILPAWAQEGGRNKILERLTTKATRKKILEILSTQPEVYWANITVASTIHSGNKQFTGTPIPEIAEKLGKPPAETALYLMETDELGTTAFFFGMNESNMWKILSEPYVMIGSDASLRAPDGPLSLDHPHPRAYGTFPKFLKAVIDSQVMPVEEAVRKMTSLPAAHFKIAERGIIKPGFFADITVADPVELKDNATWKNPHQPASGIKHVVVNGSVTVENSVLSRTRAGKILAFTC